MVVVTGVFTTWPGLGQLTYLTSVNMLFLGTNRQVIGSYDADADIPFPTFLSNGKKSIARGLCSRCSIMIECSYPRVTIKIEWIDGSVVLILRQIQSSFITMCVRITQGTAGLTTGLITDGCPADQVIGDCSIPNPGSALTVSCTAQCAVTNSLIEQCPHERLSLFTRCCVFDCVQWNGADNGYLPSIVTAEICGMGDLMVNILSAPCDNCIWENGIGYLPSPACCSNFGTCITGAVNYITRSCAHGLFWNQRVLACTYPGAATCTIDPCISEAVENSYPYMAEFCRAYYICNGDKTIRAVCCEEGYLYDGDTEECVIDTQGVCTDPCPFDWSAPECTKDPVAETDQFLERFPDGSSRLMFCPGGHIYSDTSCGCIPISTDRSCKVALSLTFRNGGIRDTSPQGNWLSVHRVSAVQVAGAEDGWAGRFRGDSMIIIPRFANSWFGKYVLLTARVQEILVNPIPQNVEILVGNSECDIAPSVFLGYDRGRGTFVGEISPSRLPPSTINLDASISTWREVQLLFDGDTVRIRSPPAQDQTATRRGNIRTVQPALHIGGQWCAQDEAIYANFTGYIDKVELWLCDG